jgi:hypothetical protein
VRLIAINGGESGTKLTFKWWNDFLLKLMS